MLLATANNVSVVPGDVLCDVSRCVVRGALREAADGVAADVSSGVQ